MNPRAFWRFFAVLWHLFPLLVAYARDRRRYLIFGPSREVSPAVRRRRATVLLDSLVGLGPTFIKLGQLLSTRPDVLPPEYVAEFTKLQDRVPPAEWENARAVVEAELGPVSEQFGDFDTDAISGASLGQVYRATVDGEDVAVKVRRPGVEALVEADLRVIRWSLPVIMRFVGEARSFSLETLADEFDKTIRQEMDYEREAAMLREIRGNFADDDRVRMPEVIDSHSTSRVLTMEYVGGTKITDLDELDRQGLDRSALAERLQKVYMEMIIEDGVFHADPHPGNLAVAADGTLVFYDFGMSGYVDPYVQDKIVDFYIAIAREDIGGILDSLVEMGTLSRDADREVMGEVIELAIQDMSGESLEQYRVQEILQKVEDTIYEFPLRLPSNLALVLRVATVVEGVCVTLDPEFDFIAVATDFLGSHGYVEEGVREYLGDRREELGDAASASLRIPPKLESVLDSFEHDSVTVTAELQDEAGYFDTLAWRLILGMLLAAGLVSTTLLWLFSTLLATGIGALVTLVLAFALYWSFRTPRGIRAQPQFTRHQMRQQAGEGDTLGFGDSLVATGEDADEPAESATSATIPVVEEDSRPADESDAEDG